MGSWNRMPVNFFMSYSRLPVVLASQPSKPIFMHRPLSQYCGLILTCRAMIGCGSLVIFPSSTYFPWSSFKWHWKVIKVNVNIEWLVGKIRGGSNKVYLPNVWVQLILYSLATSTRLQIPLVSFNLLKHTFSNRFKQEIKEILWKANLWHGVTVLEEICDISSFYGTPGYQLYN